MKVAIYGAGSLGTVLGAYLEKGGLSADLISRNSAHIAALKKNGAHITGNADFCIPVSAFLPSEMACDYDVIILMTKSIGQKETVEFLSGKLKPDGIICTCQNGLPEAGIAGIIGEERTYGCIIGWGASYIAPGIAELTSGEETFTFTIGRFPSGSDESLYLLKSIFSLMGQVDISDDFQGARWSKLLINASFSAVSAITGLTFGGVSSSFRARHIVQLIMKECVDTTHKKGISFAPMQGKNIEILADYKSPAKKFFCYAIIPIAMRRHRKLRSSMLQDIEKGKTTEIDAIDGALLREAESAGIPVPVTEKAIEIVHRIERGELKPAVSNLELFRN